MTTREMIAEAARWRLLSLLLERPHPGSTEEVRRLAGETHDAALRRAATRARSASEGEYLRLLGPGGAVSPREVAYCGFADPGALLADVARYYDAFGYRPRAEDCADHVAVEAGFVGYLWLKDALAREDGAVRAAEITAAARDGFLRDHLAGFARRLAARLAAHPESYLAITAAALAARTPVVDDGHHGDDAGADDDASSPCGGCALT
jgi:hypothetical protein